MMLTQLLDINCHFLSKFGYNLYDLSLSPCLRYSSPVYLTAENISQVDCVHTLCLARSNQVSIEGFSDEELNYMYNGMFGSSWELALVDNKSVFLIS